MNKNIVKDFVVKLLERVGFYRMVAAGVLFAICGLVIQIVAKLCELPSIKLFGAILSAFGICLTFACWVYILGDLK